jgi:hypothetical protein
MAEALRLGWRPVPLNGPPCRHDPYAVLCAPPRWGGIVLPGMNWRQRLLVRIRWLLGREGKR